jgi:hypothetical protein
MRMSQFSRVNLVFTRDGHIRWQEIERQVLTTCGQIHRHMNDLHRICAVGAIRIPPDTARRLQSTIEKLNELAGSLTKIHFEDLFRRIEVVIGESMDVLREFRQDLRENLLADVGWKGERNNA